MVDVFTAAQTLSTQYNPEPGEVDGRRRRKRRPVYGESVAAARSHQPIVIDIRHLAWQLQAACVGMDRELFFDAESSLEIIQPVCLRCPVRQTCEDFANENRLVGYWGGKTDKERRRARIRERERAQRAARGRA